MAVGHAGGKHLGLCCRCLRVQALVDALGRRLDQQPRRLQVDRRIGQAPAPALVLLQRLAEGMPLRPVGTNAAMPAAPSPGSVCAYSTITSACRALTIQALRPSMSQPLPAGCARVVMAEKSDPAPGSVSAVQPTRRPASRSGR